MIEPIKQFREHMRVALKTMGMHDVAAQIYSHLYTDPEPLTFEDLAERTGYSLATISTTAKMLQQMPHFKRIKKPGSKKVYLTVERDRISFIKERFKKMLEYEIRPTKEHAPQIIKAMKSEIKKNSKQKDRLKAQLAIIEQHHQESLKLEDIFAQMAKKLE